ncbi:protein SHORT HYPOCOTYL IN WHITE LIGHT 1-like isoform X2 [Zingiber officinale]|uniref:protein SHORT HYPOCOTYL IN WHITE LIGHT 1-like isoform X2 n=1 Tax=Zingiber officinale TaxID=94328 RepID=UPI001C4B43F8|nr:protein SHORT HYPOCOTYL IN WHITE LIGHT 1-like isoform X2 [Zingiber officinale]
MASCSVSASVSFSASRCRRLYFSDRYRRRYLLLGSLSLPSPNRPLSATPHASKRFSSYGQETVEVVPNPRAWDGNLGGLGYEEDDDEEDDEDEDDRSLDLLVRFLNSVFRKISRRARRAVRAVLPPAIPTKLVICTFGSMVFVSILLVRGIWSGITYIRMNQYTYTNRMENEDSQWSGIQAA